MLHLFRNRAELKKAYGELQDEIHRLRDRVKQQEGATARVQDLMHELEQRLAQPSTGLTTLVFYQLRDLWKCGRELIAQLVGELAAQQEERERRHFLAEFNHRQFERRQAAEQELRQAEAVAADVRAKVAELVAARARAARWWHYFTRRDLDRRLHAMNAELRGVNAQLEEARGAYEAVMSEAPPDFPGLSVESRRVINLAAIAYAELLCLRLARTSLVRQAAEAMRRREPRDEYGEARDCLTMMGEITRARQQLQGRSGVTQEIRARSERLRAHAKYRSDLDTVPTDDSVAQARDAAADAAVAGTTRVDMPAVLREDIWDLNRLLLR